MNNFVNYLNSTNNVGGNSTGSLAETQVKSKYYDEVKVDRKIGTFISDGVKAGEHKAFILTGHAGDGKTSILVQVLKQLGILQTGEGLKQTNEYDNFFYVKDMSEISAEEQVNVLEKTLESPKIGKTSLLISNTGPLLKTFEALIKKNKSENSEDFSEKDKISLQSKLLKQLDENNDNEIEILDFKFILVNIARVDNVIFSVRILKNILNPKLWNECETCPNVNKCPIKNNRDVVFNQFERVSAFVENYYRYLYENDKRMTIRQMVGQISYALTGNLSCESVAKGHIKNPFFNYNFANLFFGYIGYKPAKDSLQIKGIEQIRNYALDKISLDADYSLFVKMDYSCFVDTIRDLLNKRSLKFRKFYHIYDEDKINNKEKTEQELGFRRAIRRYYLMYSLFEKNEDFESIMNQIYGDSYMDYKKLISSKQNKAMLKNLENIIYDALYVKNTGFLSNGKTYIPLTLRREDDVFQSVMIVLGKVNRSELKIKQKKESNKFEDFEDKHNIVLQLRNKEFRLSLPMIIYFNNLVNGAITSNNNPALTHGIAKLDAILLEEFGDDKPESEEDCELSVLINTTHGQEEECFSFSDNKLII